MSDSWLSDYFLPLAVLLSTIITITMLTLPSQYSYFNGDEIKEDSFTPKDRQNEDRSGYTYYQNHKDSKGKLRFKTSIQVVVLGDIGRSPRMQYHALSIAQHGGKVDLVGYVESEVHPDIQANRFINIVPLSPFPKRIQDFGTNKLFFLIISVFKIIWQIATLYRALGCRTKASKWMLVQTPPAIPLLWIASWICYLRKTKLVIDWHNFGYSILALRLGDDDPMVRQSMRFENHYGKLAVANFAVTDAMVKKLRTDYLVNADALHDRPPIQFQPLTEALRTDFHSKLPSLIDLDPSLDISRHKLLVSSTSWTPDEDFDLLLSALLKYASATTVDSSLPPLLMIITGKGPSKAVYEAGIRSLVAANKLPNVIIKTAWLTINDYALLLGSADLGVSLHTSSSGVDLPMKVVDMLGTGLPVAGWSEFEAWPELVQEGVNGRGFGSPDALAGVLTDLFGENGAELRNLREGALKDCERRWEEEWMPIAGKLFQLD